MQRHHCRPARPLLALFALFFLAILIAIPIPPQPGYRQRARGQMTEFGEKHLRFTVSEASIFLNEGMGLGLMPGTVSALEKRSEGWVAGLHWNRQPPDIQSFLLQTAVLNRLTASLCSALSGRVDG